VPANTIQPISIHYHSQTLGPAGAIRLYTTSVNLSSQMRARMRIRTLMRHCFQRGRPSPKGEFLPRLWVMPSQFVPATPMRHLLSCISHTVRHQSHSCLPREVPHYFITIPASDSSPIMPAKISMSLLPCLSHLWKLCWLSMPRFPHDYTLPYLTGTLVLLACQCFASFILCLLKW
jgi:hypothetical protein